MWCHVRHLNLDGLKLCRITKKDKEIVKKLEDYSKIEILTKINVNVFCYENKAVYPVYLSNQCFNDSMDLLLISNEFTSHYVSIEDFNR